MERKAGLRVVATKVSEGQQQVEQSRITLTDEHRLRSTGPEILTVSAVSDMSFPGFGPLTRIDTDLGRFPAQDLRVRDRVRLRSGCFGSIVRVETVTLDADFLEFHPYAQPVLVETGRFGYGLPAEPVLLAPGQKLSDRQMLPAAFRTAEDLLHAWLALRRPEQSLTYIQFSCEEPQDVCAGGLWLRVEPPWTRDDDLED